MLSDVKQLVTVALIEQTEDLSAADESTFGALVSDCGSRTACCPESK